MAFQLNTRVNADYYKPVKWVLQYILFRNGDRLKNYTTPNPVLTNCPTGRFLIENSLV